LQPFDYVIPRDHQEASALLAEGNGSARCLQGGTDLLIRVRGGFVRPQRVIDVKGLPHMCEITLSSEGWLMIGAACNMNQVAADPLVRAHYDLLVQACNSVASYQLRNRATVGGNCCNASPAADTAPALYCLDAAAEVFGPDGARRIPIVEFFVGPGRTALQRGEFLTGLHLPPQTRGAPGAFNKLGRTKIGDISVVNVAVAAVRAAGGPSWRIAIGAAGPTPLRAPEAEALLNADTSAAAVTRAAELVSAAARPIDDIRASAAYRRAMVNVLARRGIETVLTGLAERGSLPSKEGAA
jgi:aerobic carbon-monoxide dehydrogenase medium subunit